MQTNKLFRASALALSLITASTVTFAADLAALRGQWSGVWYIGMSSGKARLVMDDNNRTRISFTNLTDEFGDQDIDVTRLNYDGETLSFSVPRKGSALFADASEFSKGNVEAIVEAGKILGAGLQELGQTYAAEGKTALETLTADVKELTAVKSPADFFKLQGEIMRRSFDAAVATGSKRSEAFLKLANDSFAPIGTRVSVAIDKVKQAA